LEAFVLDQFLDAICDSEIAVCIFDANVAGHEETIGTEALGCGVWVVKVAGEDGGAFEPELALLAGRDVVAVGGDNSCLEVGEELADCSDACLPVLPRLLNISIFLVILDVHWNFYLHMSTSTSL
jgi:hypothetical protein